MKEKNIFKRLVIFAIAAFMCLSVASIVSAGSGDTCPEAITASLGMNGPTDGTKDQWYTYTPSADCTITISSDVMGQGTHSPSSDYDTTLYVYDACGGTQVAYDGDSGGGYTSIDSFSATGGVAYKIKWDDWYYSILDFYWEITEVLPSPGDNCGNPIIVNIPADLPYATSDTTCGRVDDYSATCLSSYDGGEDIIYELTVTSNVYIDVLLDPKGTTYTGILIDDECPDTGTCIDSSTNSGSAPHGFTGVALTTGTYYIMVDTYPAPDCIPDFDLTITAGTPPQPGDDCSNPITVTLPAALPYSDAGQTTCGRDDDYDDTCLGSYDGGEDIIYELIVTTDICIDVLLDPKGTTRTGILIDDECPDTGYCLEDSTEYGSNPHGFSIDLTAGTYYIMIDSYGYYTPCIPEFDLTITECSPPEPGDDCSDPLTVTIPAALPYTDAGQTTCGRKDDYDDTCLGSYDSGEDIIYELVVTSDVCIDVLLDPKGTTYTGILIDDTCPPGSSCIATSSGSGSNPHGFSADLTTGTYYIMIDTWAAPDCIPDFDLTITECPPPEPGTDCDNPIVVNIPADLNYFDTDTTCGKRDIYSDTALGSYDNDEDIIYELVVTEDTCVDITMDPGFATWTSIGLFDDCPDVGTLLVYDYDSGMTDREISYDLLAAESPYYLMCDIYPSPYFCYEFDLTITPCFVDPIADANGPYTADESNGHTVTLDGSGSYDPDGTIELYEWDFDGDGTYDWSSTTTGVTTHYYSPNEDRSYDVTVMLRVTDNDGLTATDTSNVHVVALDQDPPTIVLIYPKGGEILSGTVTIKWFAMDDDYPQGVGIPIYLYYSKTNSGVWMQIDGVLTNNVDYEHGEYQWNVGSLSDGSYMLLAETIDSQGNIAHDASDPFTVDNGNAGVRVADVRILDTNTGSTQWVKNGDNVEVTAAITGSISIDREDITADLTGLCGKIVIADSYDGFIATWTVYNVECTPRDGPITVTVTVSDIDSNSAKITADNTNPELSIYKPQGGLYFFNSRLLPLDRTIIIGPITIELDTNDNSGIDKAEFYLDGELMETDTGSSPEWYMHIKLRGQYNLEVIVYDHAGNKDTESKMITVYNYFGK